MENGYAAGNKGPPKAKPKPKVPGTPKVVTRSLPWEQVEGMTELLFYFIVLNGNHLSTSTKLWTKTQDQFFKQPLMLPYVELYKPKEILDDVEYGRNQSGKYGVRSKLHKAVENIVESKARVKQKKDDDDALKKKLDLTGWRVVAGPAEDGVVRNLIGFRIHMPCHDGISDLLRRLAPLPRWMVAH
ncbi:hypothetical protein B484DRAFT_400002 [Ochromonadaceae sp. CCMP2298]|nr:hypothetical protein B484DRAFT_400002 [Ochromonadaceae sp. CCMP2298]